jgi:hypothetical protein
MMNENTKFTDPAQVRNKYPDGFLIADVIQLQLLDELTAA